MDEDKNDLYPRILSKMQHLQSLITFITLIKMGECGEIKGQISEKVLNINANLTKMTHHLNSLKSINEETKEIEGGIKLKITEIDKIIAAPGTLINEEYVAKINAIGAIVLKLVELTKSTETSVVEEVAVAVTPEEVEEPEEADEDLRELENENVHSVARTAKRSYQCDLSIIIDPKEPIVVVRKALLSDFEHIADEELNTLGKYMVNRITAEQVNAFIDKLNQTLQQKSDMMSKKMSKLSFREKEFYLQYKSVKNLKHKPFIYDKHLLDVLGKKCLDKKSSQYIVILTNLKRMMSHREQNSLYYVVI